MAGASTAVGPLDGVAATLPDGNGRVGRLLVTFLLGHEKVLQRPALYLSHYLKQHRASYYDRLMAIRFAGDWEGWLQPARLAPPRPGHGGEPQEQREQFRAEIPRRVVAADRPPPRPPPSGGHAELRNL